MKQTKNNITNETPHTSLLKQLKQEHTFKYKINIGIVNI